MSNNVFVGYSPNDFFYVKVPDMPTDEKCNELINNKNLQCNTNELNFDSENCINQSLCINKNKATELMNLDNGILGSNELYMNEKMNYDNTILNTINLGIGIVFLLVVIYKNQK